MRWNTSGRIITGGTTGMNGATGWSGVDALGDRFDYRPVRKRFHRVLHERKLQKRRVTLQVRKARAGNLPRRFRIDDPQRLAERQMILRFKIEFFRFPLLAYHFVLRFVLAAQAIV